MEPRISEAGEGQFMPMEPGSCVRFKVFTDDTDGAFEMFEREVPPHTIGACCHMHLTAVETFYVVEGHPTILVGDVRKQYAPGTTLVVPKTVPHAFWNETDEPVKLLITFVPGRHHEGFFGGMSALKHGPPEEYADKIALLRQQYDSNSVRDHPLAQLGH